MEQRLVNIRE